MALIDDNGFNRGTAFTREERDALDLTGLLPHRVTGLEEQAALTYRQLHAQGDTPLERYVELADVEARNFVLYYRVLVDHLEELLPIVYTPTVGKACQEYSRIFRRGRGLWITPEHEGRIADVLRHAPWAADVRLICVTDNERILGLGDQGAGGMGIPVGKLDLYTVGAGIHPTSTLPISFDVGTDNEALLADADYLGWRGRRLRGARYDALVEELVEAIREVFPEAVLQWEDFKKANAFRLLDRYRERLPSFNDDIQGTAGMVLAGLLAGARLTGTPLAEQRIVIVGAGAAGVGIARIVRAELARQGVDPAGCERAIALLDSHGLLTTERPLEAHKEAFAWAPARAAALGLAGGADLEATVKALEPTALLGTTGQAGLFTEPVVRAMAERCARPMIFPLSNPTAKAEAKPADLVRWTEGRALIATGSPFEPVEHAGRTIRPAQGNNVYVFPGVGLGVLASRARRVDDTLFAVAARALAGEASGEGSGALFPPLGELRRLSRVVARAVAREAVARGDAPEVDEAALDARIDALFWEPRYPALRLAEPCPD
ncbi:MAG: NAD-dependent malic enzyme [Sandaracinus sp.]|nr:NAD-dependent malic enzyme [Myxococcales bacterium]MAT26962.1 NAD-dependent malic enzyme [Sandaracinus sp.]MBJ71721.1 NAD-dependent malic enzyme [Sandaracinus sp.]